MKRLSIGFRLTLWYLAIFAVAQIVFATGMWLTLRYHLYAITDDNLRDEITDLRTLLESQSPNASNAALQEALARSYADSGEYLEVYDQSGNLIFHSPALHGRQLAWKPAVVDGSESFQNLSLGKRHLRFITRWVESGDRRFLVHFGLSARQVRETLEAFQEYLWMVAPLVLLLAAGVGYWLSRRALAPVDQLTRTARMVSGSNLSGRLEKLHTGDELQRLSDTLNEMLDRIEAAFRRVSQFTADASHELRTPVSLIRTEAELTLRRSRDPEEYRAALEHIQAETERTTRLLEQLLALARADSGRETLEIGPLDPRILVQRVADTWEGVVRARGLEFSAEITPDEVSVLGDESALRRVLEILLDNALKYSAEVGRIRLTLARTGERAIISVEDQGVGIPAEEQEKIFERFYRVDKARSRTLGGSGLGLSIARWIVQQHGGAIRVKSKVGEGSVFEVAIPLSSATAGPIRSVDAAIVR
jgi:heavy metal sensor kinase